jgi:hypothetical protein
MEKITNLDKVELISTLHKIRVESSNFLPINNSFIRFDLLNLIMLHELEGEELSFKKLYSSVNHSDIGLRNHLMKLKDAGWISINESKKDARSKIITATDKLHKTYDRLSEALRKKF